MTVFNVNSNCNIKMFDSEPFSVSKKPKVSTNGTNKNIQN